MTRQLTNTRAVRIARTLQRQGFTRCTSAHVWNVWCGDALEDAALESAILQAFEREGVAA